MYWENTFKNPGMECRVKPFWFWNGEITEEGIEKQIREMYDKGIGGFYLSPRQGQQIPYLSKRWFELVRFACEEAKKYGMEAWLYDEYPYPSGMAGGKVLTLHPEAEHKILCHECFYTDGGKIERHISEDGEILYAKAFPVDESGDTDWSRGIDLEAEYGILQTEEIYQITGLTMYNNKRFFSYHPRNVLTAELPQGRWKIEVFCQKPMGDFKFYGGYFDPCHQDAVADFIRLTHDAYKDALGPDMAACTKGIFSDEVGMLSPIPWSDRVPKEFRKRKGYSIIENLPALHNPSWKHAYRIRYDLYDVVNQIFVESYHKQVADWCTKEGIRYCTEVPFMRLSTQRYSDIPGGDTAHEKAGRNLEWIYDKYLCSFRYSANAVSSLARQLDRKQCLIESFHSVGWTMTLQDAKWMLDRLAASGINLYVFHAFYYTIESINKHDAPPSQFYQNPYWEHYRKLADYAARLSAYVTETDSDTQIAVLDPVPSLWALLGNPFQGFQCEAESEDAQRQCDELRNNWVYVTKTILLNQLQYDHLDSEMLPDFEVKEGKLKKGRAQYKVIVIPPSLFYEKKALQKLQEFTESGGYAVIIGNLPYLSLEQEETDEEAAREWKSFSVSDPEHVIFLKTEGKLCHSRIEEQLIGILKVLTKEPLEVILSSEEERKNFITSLRRDKEGGLYLSLVNQGKHQAHVTLENRTDRILAVKELRMEDGEVQEAGYLGRKSSMILAPYESRYYRFRAAKYANEAVLPGKRRTQRIKISCREPFAVTPLHPNVYRLAEFDISRDGENWFRTEPMTLIEHAAAFPLLGKDDYEYTSSFGTPKHIYMKFPLKIYFRTEFEIATGIEKMELLFDRRTVSGDYQIRINGKRLNPETFYYRFVNDENNRLCDISEFIKTGENTVEVEVTAWQESDGLRDPLYLLGEFGVSEKHILTEQPSSALFDSHFIKGFPYYSGKMLFEKEVELSLDELEDDFELAFDFGDECLDCLEVRLNSVQLGVRAFTPYVWKCRKDIVRQGKNHLELIRTNTLAGMLDGTYFDYDSHSLVHI